MWFVVSGLPVASKLSSLLLGVRGVDYNSIVNTKKYKLAPMTPSAVEIDASSEA